MRVLSLLAAASALAASVSAAAVPSSNRLTTYTVTCQTHYLVQNGDTCSAIGKTFNILTSSIKDWNPSINPSCTNLYIGQILCLSPPTTETNVVLVGATATVNTAKTISSAKSAVTVLAMATSQCTTDDDCAGVYCCNLANNQCVLDPDNNICDIPPKTTTTTKTSTAKTTTTKATTTAAASATCVAGSSGLGKGDGYNGYCCKTQADCIDDCISGKCNGPTNTKTTTTKKATTTTKTTTTKTTTTKTTTTKTTTTAAASATCVAGSSGLGKGDGYNGYCCKTQADCIDDCISGKCNGPTNTKTTTTKKATTTTKTTTASVKTTTVAAAPTGLTVQLSSSTDFCIFLPPSPGNMVANGNKQDTDAIANSEKTAVAFCTVANVNAPHAGLLPDGFIQSVNFQRDTSAGFVQIRGTIKNSVYNLSSKDQGGQYDNHGSKSPPNSSCAGYPYYVELVEPNTSDFCIRCCQSYTDCNAGRSAYGCDRVVPAL